MVDFVTDKCPHGIDKVYRCTTCEPIAPAPAAHPALLRGVTAQLREASNSLVQIARAVAADRDEAFALLDQVATTLEQTNSDRVLARRIRNFLGTHPR